VKSRIKQAPESLRQHCEKPTSGALDVLDPPYSNQRWTFCNLTWTIYKASLI